jgi:hypothetical protein
MSDSILNRRKALLRFGAVAMAAYVAPAALTITSAQAKDDESGSGNNSGGTTGGGDTGGVDTSGTSTSGDSTSGTSTAGDDSSSNSGSSQNRRRKGKKTLLDFLAGK